MTLEELKQDKVFRYFWQVSRIPRASGCEQALSARLAAWARELGYETVRDAADNVFIRVPASPGMEDRPSVLLQAHMDMVCEKIPSSKHDFGKDPIPWVVEGDLLTTGGETTLGADDGIGVALAMALLAEPEWKHPTLEVLFTTNEEEDFTGASTFDMKQIRSRFLINLDHVRENETLCGSCGGMRVDMVIPLERVGRSIPPGDGFDDSAMWSPDIPDEDRAYWRVTVGGLIGGHSGEDIHRGRGNANVLMGRVMARLKEVCHYHLTEVKGGTYRLAIPREASFAMVSRRSAEPRIRETIARLEAEFRREMALSGSSVYLRLEDITGEQDPREWSWAARGKYHPEYDPAEVIRAISLTPDGIYLMNEAFPGIVDTSDNLGEIFLEENSLHMVLEIRSAAESLRWELFRRMELTAGMLGGSAEWADAYPSWDFHAGSPLQQRCARVYRERTGRDMTFLTVHAGLEVGYFLGGKPDLDAVSVGPDIWDFHSPSERVSISSTRRVFEYLKDLVGSPDMG